MRSARCGRPRGHYLALHDIQMRDGETTLEGSTQHLRDLRGLMTYVPPGSRVSGWSSYKESPNGYLAVIFDPSVICSEMGERSVSRDPRPMLYFENPSLRATLSKIASILNRDSPVDGVYAETLTLLAVLELERIQRDGAQILPPVTGRLTPAQQRAVQDFIAENLHLNLSLSNLAEVTGLSRFHFARAFKQTFGIAPHQFVVRQRIDRAKLSLAKTDTPIIAISESIGFRSASHFAQAFNKATGDTPAQFRRRNR